MYYFYKSSFVAKGVYRDIDLHVHDQPDGWMEKDIDE